MKLSDEYTLQDHLARDGDRYAQAKYEITRKWILSKPQQGMTLVNIGCGGGYFNSLASQMGLKVIACEPDSEAFEIARASANQSSIEVLNLDLAGFAAQGKTGDVVVCHDVLEHIEDDNTAVALLYTICAPAGRVIVSVPALQSLFGRHDEELGHYRRYSRKTLTRVLEPYFRIERVRYFGALSIPIVFFFSRLLRRPYPASANGRSLLANAYGFVCDIETKISFPVGTSLIAELTPRAPAGPPRPNH